MAKNMKYKGYYINRKNFHALKRSIAMLQFVVSKAKGRISKRVLQENKTRQIFRKTNIFYPLIVRIRGLEIWKNFRKIWLALFSCYLHFEISPFALLPKSSESGGTVHIPLYLFHLLTNI